MWPPEAGKCATASCVTRTVLSALALNCSAKKLASMVPKGRTPKAPALLTTMSMRPNALTTAETIDLTADRISHVAGKDFGGAAAAPNFVGDLSSRVFSTAEINRHACPERGEPGRDGRANPLRAPGNQRNFTSQVRSFHVLLLCETVAN